MKSFCGVLICFFVLFHGFTLSQEQQVGVVTTVSNLNLHAFVGRWFVMYSSKLPLATVLLNAHCVMEDLTLYLNAHIQQEGVMPSSEVMMNVDLAFNLNSPSGQRRKITGTATNSHFASAPGQWDLDLPVSAMKIEMGGVSTDFSVLAVGDVDTHLKGVSIDSRSTLDPATGVYHGPFVIPGPPVAPTGQYPWAILSDSKKSQLFVLAREVSVFAEKYESTVLQKVVSLGFTSEELRPVAVDQSAECVYDSAV